MKNNDQMAIPIEIRPENYRLTKLKDTEFDGKHPNGYYEGIVIKGHSITELEVGKSFFIFYNNRFTQTSTVTEIISPTEFRTQNSIYKIETLNEITD